MEYVQDFLANRVLWVSFFAWFVAQLIKVILVLIQEKRFDIGRMIGSGGMPSSHSSFVMALTTSVAFESGLSSPLFAACVVFSFVVMYDASGVRRETGRQAEVLNDILENFGKQDPEIFGKQLKELIGHEPIEVFAGALLGTLCGILVYL